MINDIMGCDSKLFANNCRFMVAKPCMNLCVCVSMYACIYIFHTHETSLLLLSFFDFKSFTNCGLKKSYARLFKMG